MGFSSSSGSTRGSRNTLPMTGSASSRGSRSCWVATSSFSTRLANSSMALSCSREYFIRSRTTDNGTYRVNIYQHSHTVKPLCDPACQPARTRGHRVHPLSLYVIYLVTPGRLLHRFHPLSLLRSNSYLPLVPPQIKEEKERK